MNYKDTNDYEVMYLIGENTEDAVETIFQKYKPFIMITAYKYYKAMEGKGLELDDFIQEGYIGLDRAIKRYSLQKDCLFYTFATLCIERQMQTVIRNFLTKKQEILNNAVSLECVLPYTDMIVGDVVDEKEELDPLENILDIEQQNELIMFLHELPFIQAQVFELRYNGFSYEEIGILLELTKKSIDSHLVRIRRKLRNTGLYHCYLKTS